MTAPPSLADEIRRILAGLRSDAPTHSVLNNAATGIDHLGRHLYGLGYVRVREIADCFTAAVQALGGAHVVPEEERGAVVQAAIGQLEAALAHVEEGGLSAA